MGNSQGFGPVIDSSELSASVAARYHQSPKKVTDDYDIGKTALGAGRNGSVFKATSKGSGASENAVWAVKPFKLSSLGAKGRKELVAEADIFLKMDHPHVARLVDVYEDTEAGQMLFVMECCEGGELLTRAKEKKIYPEVDAAHAIWQMLLAMNYIHAQGIVHRDVKLENFLYEKKDEDHIKLIDFGFSRILARGEEMKGQGCGSMEYTAPEVFEQRFSSQSDMWSVGVVAFILMLGYMPFKSEEDIGSAVYKKRPERWDAISDDAKNFLESLLVKDWQQRLTPIQGLQHPFICKRDQTGRTFITPYQLTSFDDDSSVKLNVRDEVLEALCQYATVSRFRRAILALLAWCLTQDEQKEVRDAFLELDLKREGRIKLDDLKVLLTNKLKFGNAKAAAILGSLAGQKGLDELTYSDFLGAMVKQVITLKEGHFLNVFRRFDTQNRGHITPSDLAKVFGRAFDTTDIGIIVAAIDPTGTGVISYKQLLTYLEVGGTERGASTDEVEVAVETPDDAVPDSSVAPKKNGKRSNAISVKLTPEQMKQAADLTKEMNEEEERERNNPDEPKKAGGCCVVA